MNSKNRFQKWENKSQQKFHQHIQVFLHLHLWQSRDQLFYNLKVCGFSVIVCLFEVVHIRICKFLRYEEGEGGNFKKKCDTPVQKKNL
jgi:hypothetical protein